MNVKCYDKMPKDILIALYRLKDGSCLSLVGKRVEGVKLDILKISRSNFY